jgi:hypothetical protein
MSMESVPAVSRNTNLENKSKKTKIQFLNAVCSSGGKIMCATTGFYDSIEKIYLHIWFQGVSLH